jgi:hypothetical protein
VQVRCARLAGLEPATGCLEDTTMLSGSVPDLRDATAIVQGCPPAARSVGVNYRCQPPDSTAVINRG